MKKHEETTKPTEQPTTEQTIETVETVELDNVTGGCARCGCSNGANAALRFAAGWRQ